MLLKEGENVAKLEKADILELTVRHLHTLRRQNILGIRSENTYAEKFKAGFRHCAAEVSNFLNVVDQETSVPIIKHLNSCMNHMERSTVASGNAMHMHHPAAAQPPPPPAVPLASRPPSIQIQSPNQINAHAVAAHRQSPPNAAAAAAVWSTKGRSPVPIMPQPKHQMMFQQPPPPPTHQQQQPPNANHHHHQHHHYVNRSPNSTPDTHLMDSSTRVNTPPMSPKIDVDDSVWRPW